MIVIIRELVRYKEIQNELKELYRRHEFEKEMMARHPNDSDFIDSIAKIEKLKMQKESELNAWRNAILQAASEVKNDSKQISMLNKKNIILWWILMVIMVFIISAVKLYGQTSVTICPPVNPTNFSPAPCSIEGASMEVTKFVIQIGVYRNRITPQPYTMCLQVGDLYYYYIAKFYDSREQAQEELKRLQGMIDRSTGKSIYCDAIVTPSPLKDLSFFE